MFESYLCSFSNSVHKVFSLSMNFILQIIHFIALHYDFAGDLVILLLFLFKLILLTCIPLFKIDFLFIFALISYSPFLHFFKLALRF